MRRRLCRREFAKRWGRFAVGLGVIALVWLVALPRLGERPGVRAKIEREEAQGINPEAMFYTELESMPAIVEQVNTLRNANPNAFGGW